MPYIFPQFAINPLVCWICWLRHSKYHVVSVLTLHRRAPHFLHGGNGSGNRTRRWFGKSIHLIETKEWWRYNVLVYDAWQKGRFSLTGKRMHWICFIYEFEPSRSELFDHYDLFYAIDGFESAMLRLNRKLSLTQRGKLGLWRIIVCFSRDWGIQTIMFSVIEIANW